MPQILIKNGRVWDGHRFFQADVLTQGPVIAQIAPDISCPKAFVYDAAGSIVSAGLVDCHMHMRGISGAEYAIQTESICFPFGATAAADAGGRHGNRELVESFAVKSVVFAEIRFRDNHLDRETTVKRLTQYGDRAIGFKLFYDETDKNIGDITALREACAIAREFGAKLMIHCNHSPSSMLSIVEAMAPGDILSHVYHGGKNDCTADDFAAFRLAREKGVVMDAAFAGQSHTNFGVLRQAFERGFFPDTISTDITSYSAFMRGGRYGLTTCMSMAATAGMAEEAIFRAVTTAPAAALGQPWGRLEEGGTADLAVLTQTREPFSFTDKTGNTLQNDIGYRCRLTVSDGVLIHLD